MMNMTTELAEIDPVQENRTSSAPQVKFVGIQDVFCFVFIL